jgi:hypothetical protein
MGRQRSGCRRWLGAALGAVQATTAWALLLSPGAAWADNPYSTSPSLQQQVIDYGPGNTKPKSLFDAKNPGDMINTLRKGAALDNATPPGDAVDSALRAFDAQNAPASKPPLKGP